MTKKWKSTFRGRLIELRDERDWRPLRPATLLAIAFSTRLIPRTRRELVAYLYYTWKRKKKHEQSTRWLADLTVLAYTLYTFPLNITEPPSYPSLIAPFRSALCTRAGTHICTSQDRVEADQGRRYEGGRGRVTRESSRPVERCASSCIRLFNCYI